MQPTASRADFARHPDWESDFDSILETGCGSAHGYWGVTTYANEHNPFPKDRWRHRYVGFHGVIVRSSYFVKNGGTPGETVTDLNYDPVCTVKRVKDGLSKTAMVGEKRLPLGQYGGGRADDDRGWSDGWDLDTVRSTICHPQPDSAKGVISPVITPGSAHGSGFNCVFADGAVHFINYEIDLETFNMLGHRADGQSYDSSDI